MILSLNTKSLLSTTSGLLSAIRNASKKTGGSTKNPVNPHGKQVKKNQNNGRKYLFCTISDQNIVAGSDRTVPGCLVAQYSLFRRNHDSFQDFM